MPEHEPVISAARAASPPSSRRRHRAATERHEHAWPATTGRGPEELPRGRAGGCSAPVPLALLGVLLIACGFIGGVLVEKGETLSRLLRRRAGGGPRLPRFAALRAARTGAPAPPARARAHVRGRLVGARRPAASRDRPPEPSPTSPGARCT